MKYKYKLQEINNWVELACECCVDVEYYVDIVDDDGELIDGGFPSKEDALIYILKLHDIEVKEE